MKHHCFLFNQVLVCYVAIARSFLFLKLSNDSYLLSHNLFTRHYRVRFDRWKGMKIQAKNQLVR